MGLTRAGLNHPFMKSLLVGLLALFTAAAWAQAPQPPEIAARQYILLDLTSGQAGVDVQEQVLAVDDPVAKAQRLAETAVDAGEHVLIPAHRAYGVEPVRELKVDKTGTGWFRLVEK